MLARGDGGEGGLDVDELLGLPAGNAAAELTAFFAIPSPWLCRPFFASNLIRIDFIDSHFFLLAA